MSEKKEFDRDSISNTLIIAIGLSLVCSIIVSSAAIVLKPVQEKNEEAFRQRIILDVAGLMEPGGDIDDLFQAIEPRMVNLETGDYTDAPMRNVTSPFQTNWTRRDRRAETHLSISS